MQGLVPIGQLGPSGFPEEDRRPGVGLALNHLGQAERASGDAGKIVADRDCHQRQDQTHRQKKACQRRPEGRTPLSKHPRQRNCAHPQAQGAALIRPAGRQNRGAETHQQRVAQPQLAHHSGQRPQHQSAADGWRRSSPIAVHPVPEKPQAQDHQQTAEQRPTRRQPALQHPADGRAHQGGAEVHPRPGVAREADARSQNQSLRRLVHRHVGGLLERMNAFQVLPHGMRRIRQPPRRERVGREEIDELIGDERLANRQGGDRQNEP